MFYEYISNLLDVSNMTNQADYTHKFLYKVKPLSTTAYLRWVLYKPATTCLFLNPVIKARNLKTTKHKQRRYHEKLNAA